METDTFVDNVLPEWQSLRIRLTAFPTQPIIPKVGVWEKLVGSPPDSFAQPRPGVVTEAGTFESSELSLTQQGSVIEWRLAAAESEEPPLDFPYNGSASKAIDVFLPLMVEWLKNDAPPLQRLAFGAILLLPVDTKESGYKRLQPYLPYVQIDMKNTSDFLYQINRPVASGLGIPELRINRFCKWSLATWMLLSVPLNAPSILGAHPVESPSQSFACQLDLDINTSPEWRNPLPEEKVVSIFKELVSLGQGIMSRGDTL